MPEGGAFAGARSALQAGSEAGLYSGAVAAVCGVEGPIWAAAAGSAAWIPRRRPLHVDTPFDLASLTKVLCTTPLALRLDAAGLLPLDRPLAALVPGAPPGVTARHCLQHSSGLPAWAPLWRGLGDGGPPWGSRAARAALVGAAIGAAPVAPPGAVHRYSDLGMILLGAALEAAGGARLDALFAAEVGAPWGLDLRWGWPEAAATEACPVRGRVLAGEVHDLNAAALGGIAPHAGLFGAAAEVAAAGAAWLRAAAAGGPWAQRLQEALRAPGPGPHRLGWEAVTPGASAAGPAWPADGVGHLGFTGTALYLHPRAGLAVALLANRVHPVVEGGAVPDAPPAPRVVAFRAHRPRVFAAVVDGLRATGRWAD